MLPLPQVTFGFWEELPEIPAVYFSLANNGEVLYIGSTINLYLRWSRRPQHHKFAELQRERCVVLAWQEMPVIQLLIAESVMVDSFRPRLNQNIPRRKTSLTETYSVDMSLLYARVLSSVLTLEKAYPMPLPQEELSQIFRIDIPLTQKRMQRKSAWSCSNKGCSDKPTHIVRIPVKRHASFYIAEKLLCARHTALWCSVHNFPSDEILEYSASQMEQFP